MGQSRGRRGIRTKEMIAISHERIERLFFLAKKEALAGNQAQANRYTSLAAKIGMRYNVRLSKKYKLEFCRKCHTFFVPGKNCRVRLSKGKMTIHCDACGNDYRVPYK